MTDDQLLTLKTFVLASPDQAIQAAASSRNDTELAKLLNLPSSKWIWLKEVTPDMWRSGLTKGASQLDALTVGKRDSLLFMCGGTLDCTDPLIRSNLDDLMGSQNALKAAVIAVEKRIARVVESIFIVGTGSQVSPGVTSFYGEVNVNDIGRMWNL